MESRRGAAASLQIKGPSGLAYRATGLPPGLTISPSGLITGTGRKPGTSTVTVSGTPAAGAASTITFIWTVS
jgi:beta-glucosidase